MCCRLMRRGGNGTGLQAERSHEWTEDQTGRRINANTSADAGWRVHTADETLGRNAATTAKHCSCIRQGG